jgi:hypothetical protein
MALRTLRLGNSSPAEYVMLVNDTTITDTAA